MTFVQQPLTYTTRQMTKWYELDVIEDDICGLYGQDSHIMHSLSPEDRAVFQKQLDRILQGVREWRHRWAEGMPDETLRALNIVPNMRQTPAALPSTDKEP